MAGVIHFFFFLELHLSHVKTDRKIINIFEFNSKRIRGSLFLNKTYLIPVIFWIFSLVWHCKWLRCFVLKEIVSITFFVSLYPCTIVEVQWQIKLASLVNCNTLTGNSAIIKRSLFSVSPWKKKEFPVQSFALKHRNCLRWKVNFGLR